MQGELLGHIKPMPLAPIHIPFLYGDIAPMVEEFMLMPSGMALIIQFGHGKILAQRHALKTWRYATWCVPSHEKACQREEMILYKKGAPAPAANRNRGWHGAVRAPVHGYHRRTIFYDPDPPHMGRGQLLSDGGRQQQDKGHCDE